MVVILGLIPSENETVVREWQEGEDAHPPLE